MNKLTKTLILAIVILGLNAHCSNKKNNALRITVLSYNIHHAAGVDKKLDLKRIAKIIREVKPDIVSLQEVENKTSRTGEVDQTAVLAKLCSMKHCFGPAIKFSGGHYGNAILSRFPIKKVKHSALPGREARNLLEATLQLPGSQALSFLATHLDTTKRSQLKSLPIIAQRLKANAGKLMILAGDFNAVPQSSLIKTLLKDWNNATSGPGLQTFPVTAPKEQIDYIFYSKSPQWRLISQRTLDEKVASDHLPILSILELRP